MELELELACNVSNVGIFLASSNVNAVSVLDLKAEGDYFVWSYDEERLDFSTHFRLFERRSEANATQHMGSK